jgi:hypothetical protein
MQYHTYIIQISSFSQIILVIMYKENQWFSYKYWIGVLIVHSFLLTFVIRERGI